MKKKSFKRKSRMRKNQNNELLFHSPWGDFFFEILSSSFPNGEQRS
ncbi:hypothetical protein KIS1582_2345 [Cytobacillus firmus]|uniref:Uncharacterized protein n=1 Tax=Cytobacillus firmus TaxID=1399 RepID=A0A800MWM4_CYTFI|nr:hypothetical protein KIS1582_2345 [Cytobacillus firmus]